MPADNCSILNTITIQTPLGSMVACANSDGLCLLEFNDQKTLDSQMLDLAKRFSAKIVTEENQHLKRTKKELQEYFAGTRKEFTIKLQTPGTEFRNHVWQVLQDIPYGKTLSYKEQAIAIENPKAIRAVASANAQNRIAIIIPCHRVIGADGSLTGYAGGLHRKKWLLDFESKTKMA
jgi:AraC family transcriptional regulator, regulatory protein of adaptative response / methylated-DNA-[protein]-cysteine methyltransferase